MSKPPVFLHYILTVNVENTLIYWHIGDRINKNVIHDERAEYGKQIVSIVSTQFVSQGCPYNGNSLEQVERVYLIIKK